MVCTDWEQTLAGLEESLREDPKDSATCRRLADAYAVRGRLKDTISTYLHLSDLLQSQGDTDSALQVSALVLQLQPDSEKGRLQRIHLFEQRQDAQQAARSYRELALLYVDQGRGQQAIQLLERARRSQPANLELMLELAETHLAEGHLTQGLNLFAQATEGFLQVGERERACDALRRMKVLNPNDVSVLLRLGKLYLELERLSEAEQELRGVLRQTLNHEEALMLLGQVCQRKGQGRDACLAFQRLISLNPECWEAQEHLAQVMQSQGLPGEAVQYYLQAAEGFLAQGEREKAIRPLRTLLALAPNHPAAVSHLATLDAPVQPLELKLPAVAPVEEPPSTPSEELRNLKRRQMPGKKLLIKPLPGTQLPSKLPTSKPVLVKTAPVDETPLFMQSLGRADSLPDFQGSNDWLTTEIELEQLPDLEDSNDWLKEKVDELPDCDGSCAWLEEAVAMQAMDWNPLTALASGRPPCRLTWGQVWTTARFGKLSEELDFWSQVCREHPNRWQARAEWAEACLKVGLCDRAIELYREIVEVVSGREAEEMRHRLIQALIWNDETAAAAEACLGLADLYHSHGEQAEALETVHLLLQLEPQHLAARRRLVDWSEGKISRHHLTILAELAFAQENWEEAYQAGIQLLALDDSQWLVRRRVQRAAQRSGRQAEALAQARQLLDQLCQAGQWQQACVTCEELMAWEPGHTRLWVKLLEECGQPEQLAAGRLRLAAEMVELEQREQAVVLLTEKCLHYRPAAEFLLELLLQDKDARVPALGARLLEEDLRSSRFEAARRLCSRLLQAFPQAPELHFALGESYRGLGLWEEAIEQFQLSRRQAEWLHKSTHSLVLCLKQREGMDEVAKRQIEKVLLVPGKAEELEALRSLL
ncbi:MAG: tetratricopeptide repeat protein [Candidatus Eremiobacteraeota bacterium]|nr:tetratricopeptide repeat protein [Candidatus Eremiobacteraeota bacterium]MCW5865901.1 tetratricopeptide repeat protein [Candidatus Eremiobacteraeota bacterium]